MDKTKFDRYTKKIYSTIYSEPETPNFHVPLIKQSVENFVPLMKLDNNSFILDIGCGQGTFAKQMKELGYPQVVGVTMSQDDYLACQKEGLIVRKGDMSDLEDEDDSVDGIWCRHAIEHSPFPLLTLLEFNRVMKRGARLYLEVPAPDTERYHEDNPNHYSVMGERMWVNLLYRAGFESEQTGIWEFKVSQDGVEKQEKFLCFLFKKRNSIDYSEK